jgi:hypothetical protein
MFVFGVVLLGLVILAQPMVGRPQSEHESRAFLDAILDQAPLSLTFVDRDLCFALVNQIAASDARQKPDQMLGRKVADVYPQPATEILPALAPSHRQTGRASAISSPPPTLPCTATSGQRSAPPPDDSCTARLRGLEWIAEAERRSEGRSRDRPRRRQDQGRVGACRPGAAGGNRRGSSRRRPCAATGSLGRRAQQRARPVRRVRAHRAGASHAEAHTQERLVLITRLAGKGRARASFPPVRVSRSR